MPLSYIPCFMPSKISKQGLYATEESSGYEMRDSGSLQNYFNRLGISSLGGFPHQKRSHHVYALILQLHTR